MFRMLGFVGNVIHQRVRKNWNGVLFGSRATVRANRSRSIIIKRGERNRESGVARNRASLIKFN